MMFVQCGQVRWSDLQRSNDCAFKSRNDYVVASLQNRFLYLVAVLVVKMVKMHGASCTGDSEADLNRTYTIMTVKKFCCDLFM